LRGALCEPGRRRGDDRCANQDTDKDHQPDRGTTGCAQNEQASDQQFLHLAAFR
jgi:hypothetical protein